MKKDPQTKILFIVTIIMLIMVFLIAKHYRDEVFALKKDIKKRERGLGMAGKKLAGLGSVPATEGAMTTKSPSGEKPFGITIVQVASGAASGVSTTSFSITSFLVVVVLPVTGAAGAGIAFQ